MKKLIALVLIAPLTACGSMSPKVIQKPVMVERPPLMVQEPQPVDQLPIEFLIITKENYEQKLKLLEEKAQGPVVLFALNSDGYQNLSMNVAELRRYIIQQNTVIEAYKTYYIKKDEPPPEQPKEEKPFWKLW
jgi:hypothetical protein